MSISHNLPNLAYYECLLGGDDNLGTDWYQAHPTVPHPGVPSAKWANHIQTCAQTSRRQEQSLLPWGQPSSIAALPAAGRL